MKCTECGSEMIEMDVEVEGAETTSKGWRCPECGEYKFDSESGLNIVKELRFKEALEALRQSNLVYSLEQKISRISKDHIGIYVPDTIIQKTDLHDGQAVQLIVLDKKHLLIELP
ncbi:MAG: hypothetical protein ACE5KT_05165 [Methanosarcinales archaeon]